MTCGILGKFSTGDSLSDEYQTDDPGNFPLAEENPPENERTPEEDE